ncbi:hypothetical protein GALMADRAFT_230492 [Galerina marginata CBS 339.88]|uniref:Dynamin N-terminal domain-containing protein n=1 Tax=Galerina marginata (strain CBS 339.88) TaxID=685588 RepID=A0A067SFX8_GALM3|nr:hypothetical protein GALMADRAFT_230492 [Galerina marginata CBS 339.88]
MPIDTGNLVRLLSTLTYVITALQKQYDDYDKLQANKQESIITFWNAVSRLTDDLRTYQEFVKVLHERQSVFASFITGNSADWDRFESALGDIQSKYRELQGHEPSGPGPERKGVAKRIMAPLIFIDVLNSSIKRIGDATAGLESDAEALERAYQRLRASYMIHIISSYQDVIPQKLGTILSDSSALLKAIDTVVSSFNKTPFHLSTTTVAPETLFKLNQDRDVADRVTNAMKAEGDSWAESLIHSNSIDEFSRIQRHTMELLWAACIPQMESEELKFARSGDERISDNGLKELSSALKSAVARADKQSFSIAFCGMVKAGKSLFLNAMMSQTILPSDELPSTAWPCRLRHVPNQSIPTLMFDPKPFQEGLNNLQDKKIGSKMQDYKPLSDDPFDDTGDTNVLDPLMTESEDYAGIYYNWKDLHQKTRENLLEFENPNFKLLSNVEGRDQVAKLLGQLNDIVRLCHRFKLGFPAGSGEWPLLCVEFASLRDRSIEGTFEFIDLPGLGEEFDSFSYQDMITRVATQANAVVPIVSFKEIAKQDWRKLPVIISSGLKTRASMVICTHFDQISQSNLDEQIATVAKVFWSEPSAATHRVIPCSSKMGLSAAHLRHHLADKLPEFSSIYNANPDDIRYPVSISG